MFFLSFSFSMTPPPPRSTLFPYTTLFRSFRPRVPRVPLPAHQFHRPQSAAEEALADGLKTQRHVGDVVARLAEAARSEEHTSELQSLRHLVCRLLLEKKKKKRQQHNTETT